MEPGSRVELPPRGADLSFLGDPDTDTPSKWLTFNSTPGGGNTTPGTAFGSPFWGSLAAANGQGTSNTPTTANFKHSPKAYSPSKELNPFELSFFPKHNEHLLAPVNAAGVKDGNNKSTVNASSKEGQFRSASQQDDGEDIENIAGNTSLSSSVSSLKRPFHADSSTTSLQNDASSRALPLDESGHPLPSWKRPKLDELNMSNPSSSDLSSTTESGASAYAPSPSMTLNMNASPDSGSPASSSMIPTPSLQHATLPPNATSTAIAQFNPTTGGNLERKLSFPLEQIEVAKLAPNGIFGNVNTVSVNPQQQDTFSGVLRQNNILTQSVPPPMNSAAFTAQQSQHQPGGHQYSGYTGYMSHAQQQQQQQAQPVILPPKTLLQAQQEQRTGSPVTSHPPQSARQASPEQQQNQPPAPGNNNNSPIPYANGRGPARPSRSTRSNRRGSTAPISGNEGIPNVKQEEDLNMDYSSSIGNISSGALNPANYNTVISSSTANAGQGATGTSQKTTTTAATTSNKKGKKNQHSNNEGRATSVSGSSSGKKGASYNDNNNNGGGYSASGGGDGFGGSGIPNGEGAGDDEEDGDDEHKRKAFLERNRQAACRSRQKKKEWINNLETHAARLQSENQSLASEIDTLRKELFALRHTLSFHERSGCTAAGAGTSAAPSSGATGNHQHQQQVQNQPSATPASIPQQTHQQQQQLPDWRQQQQPSHTNTMMQQQEQPQYQQGYQQNMSYMSHPPAIVQTHASPQSHPSSAQDVNNAPRHPPIHIQTQPQPLSARPSVSGGPTLAPPVLHGMNVPTSQSQLGGLDQQSFNSQQRAPPKLNLSPASLQPQNLLSGLNRQIQNGQLPSQQQDSNNNQLGTTGDINRPGSAGATFGLATPNFADLFNGAMGKLGNGGQTPGFGAGLLFTPGGIFSSGGMLGGGSTYNNNNNTNNSTTGYNMSPGLPNTFGLSIQDIPIRPASAPPTPSPALDTRLMAPSQDYFSSKNLSNNLGTSAAFADFLAAYPSNVLHANSTGSVLA